ncbi:MAG: right-handed parallel beta-helix repeat-containing protein [bacterium]
MRRKKMFKNPLIVFFLLLIASSAFAKTSVPSEIKKNTVWTKSQSPYEIEKDILIKKDALLTIEPGVKIVFKAISKTESEDKRIKIVVQGNLIANGTSAEKIIFNSSEKLLGVWGGIIFENIKDNRSILENCQIENARCAVTCLNSSPVITNCYFAKNELAIDCEDWASPVISNNIFTDNGMSVSTIGVINCARYSSPKIKNNLIQKNVGPNIQVSLFSSPEISQNIITYNTSHGIISNSFSEPVILNNEISYNGCFGQQGIAVNQSSPTIMGNYIHNNCKIGISVSSDSYPLISGNRITNNEEGIICVDSSPVLTFNIFKTFNHGIIISGNSSPVINYNNFQPDSKTIQNIVLENCSGQINAQNNWWGDIDMVLIEKNIADNKTNPSLGPVVITPFLNSEVNLNDYSNLNLDYLNKISSNRRYIDLKSDFLFLSFRDGNWEIYSANINAEKISNLTKNINTDVAPCISPDNKEIAFSSNRSGNLDIFVMDKNGKNIKQITDNIFNESVPLWSNDGHKLAFWSELRQVFVIDKDGKNKKSIDPNAYLKELPDFKITSYLWPQNH